MGQKRVEDPLIISQTSFLIFHPNFHYYTVERMQECWDQEGNHVILSYSSEEQKSNSGLTGLKSRSQQGYVPFWRLQGTIRLPPFLSQRQATSLGWRPVPPSSQLATSNLSDTFSVITALSDHSWEKFSACKDSRDETESTWIIQDTLPRSRSSFILNNDILIAVFPHAKKVNHQT